MKTHARKCRMKDIWFRQIFGKFVSQGLADSRRPELVSQDSFPSGILSPSVPRVYRSFVSQHNLQLGSNEPSQLNCNLDEAPPTLNLQLIKSTREISRCYAFGNVSQLNLLLCDLSSSLRVNIVIKHGEGASSSFPTIPFYFKRTLNYLSTRQLIPKLYQVFSYRFMYVFFSQICF